MLWDLIRDFFVNNVFGGHTSEVVHNALTGQNYYVSKQVTTGLFNTSGLNIYYQIGVDASGQPVMMCLSDYLSTIATIISITIIVVLCCLFIKQLVKLVGGLLR